jgi:hypothetical protein
VFSPANPYSVDGPVQSAERFVGRRDALLWIEQTLAINERLLIICGPALIGKSSLLLQVQREAPASYLPVYVDLLTCPQGATLTACVVERVHQRLLQEAAAGERQIAPSAPASVWKALRELSPARRPLLLLDNLDRVLASGESAGWSFLDDLAELMTLHPDLQVVCAVRSVETLRRIDRLPFARAPWRKLEPLTRAEAMRLIREPAAGQLEYEYDAVQRIDELTARLPYYVQLLCGQLYEMRAGAGHVGMVDIEPALRALGELLLPPAVEMWDQATPEGKLILSLLASLKGGTEVFTHTQVIAGLRGWNIEADTSDVTQVLSQLVAQGALQQLGALTYRFPVDVLRHWVRVQHPMPATTAAYRWQPQRRRPPARPVRPAQPAAAPEETPTETPPSRRLSLVYLIPAATVIIALGLLLIPWRQNPPPAPSPTPTPELATLAAILLGPTDTPQPTSTRPLVIARSLPALAFMRQVGSAPFQIWVMGADGSLPAALTSEPGENTAPAWSPDGRRIVFVSDRDGNKEIYAMNADGSKPMNLTRHESDDWTPAWSPDGTEIAFASMRDGNWEIYVMWADGAAPLRLTNDPASDFAPAWSPDGRRIAFCSNRDGNYDIYVMDRDGNNLKRLTRALGNDLSPAWSPDGRYIAFESMRDGNFEIYRMLEDGTDQTNLTNAPRANDHWPTWSPDGTRIAFASNRDGNWNIYVMAADGSNVVRLTQDKENNQGPAWRP